MAKTVQIKLFGPWNRVKNLLNNLAPNLREIAISSQRSVAEKFVRRVKAHLKNQDIPGWTPLSNRYAYYKMGKFGTEDILIATWEYYDNSKAWREGGLYQAGVPRSVSYKNGVEIARVAHIHELWSTMPGRPHRPLWNYTLKEDMGGLQGIKQMVNQIIKQKLILKGYPVRSIRF